MTTGQQALLQGSPMFQHYALSSYAITFALMHQGDAHDGAAGRLPAEGRAALPAEVRPPVPTLEETTPCGRPVRPQRGLLQKTRP